MSWVIVNLQLTCWRLRYKWRFESIYICIYIEGGKRKNKAIRKLRIKLYIYVYVFAYVYINIVRVFMGFVVAVFWDLRFTPNNPIRLKTTLRGLQMMVDHVTLHVHTTSYSQYAHPRVCITICVYVSLSKSLLFINWKIALCILYIRVAGVLIYIYMSRIFDKIHILYLTI